MKCNIIYPYCTNFQCIFSLKNTKTDILPSYFCFFLILQLPVFPCFLIVKKQNISLQLQITRLACTIKTKVCCDPKERAFKLFELEGSKKPSASRSFAIMFVESDNSSCTQQNLMNLVSKERK